MGTQYNLVFESQPAEYINNPMVNFNKSHSDSKMHNNKVWIVEKTQVFGARYAWQRNTPHRPAT